MMTFKKAFSFPVTINGGTGDNHEEESNENVIEEQQVMPPVNQDCDYDDLEEEGSAKSGMHTNTILFCLKNNWLLCNQILITWLDHKKTENR